LACGSTGEICIGCIARGNALSLYCPNHLQRLTSTDQFNPLVLSEALGVSRVSANTSDLHRMGGPDAGDQAGRFPRKADADLSASPLLAMRQSVVAVIVLSQPMPPAARHKPVSFKA
jgi:hypothetical protein